MKKEKTNPWYLITVGSLFLIMMCNTGVGFYTLSLFVTPISGAFGITTGDFAIVYIFYGLGSAIAAALIHPLLKKCSLKWLILLGGAISLMGYVLYLAASSIVFIYVGGTLIGASTVFAGTATVQLAVARWFFEKRSFITGLVASASGIGSAIGSPIVGKLILRYGWKTGYVFIGVLILLAVFLQVLFLFRSEPGELGLEPYGLSRSQKKPGSAITETEEGIPLRKIGFSAKTICFFGGMFCVATIYQVISVYQSSILIERGFTEETTALCLSVFAITDMCSKFLAGIVSEKAGFRVVTTYCGVAVLCGFILIRQVHTFAGAVLYSALLGFWPTVLVLYGLNVAITLFGKKYISEYISASQFIMCCCSIVGMPVVRAMYNAVGGFNGIMNLVCVVAVIFVCLMLVTLRRKNHYAYITSEQQLRQFRE